MSGLVLELEVANNVALKCAGSEWRSDVSAKQSDGVPKNENGIIKTACKSLRVRLNHRQNETMKSMSLRYEGWKWSNKSFIF